MLLLANYGQVGKLRIIDELYGVTDFPEYLSPIINSAELQRLRDVRLINTFSTSLTSLSDVKRLSHSLAVTGLFLKMKPRFLHVTNQDITLARTVEVACLIHDIATPAFAHIFEWELNKRWGWNHETQCESIIKGTYRPENIHHQIYFQKQLSLNGLIRKIGVDPEQVWLTTRGKAPFGHLISGTLDLDNIDNVLRMYTALGLGDSRDKVLSMVDSIVLNRDALIVQPKALSAIEWWLEARKQCYEIIIFDEHTLSAQAMLGQSLAKAIDAGFLGREYWHLTDEEILRRLLDFKPTKEAIKRLVTGDTYALLGLYWYDFDEEIAEYLRSPNIRVQIAEQVSSEVRLPCVIYYFEDNGTFSKKLNITLGEKPGGGKNLFLGEDSHSLVLGIFTPSHDQSDIAAARKVITPLLEAHLPKIPSQRNLPEIKKYYGIDSQTKLFV
jgi:HD superfamily phosphohydrolase